MKNFKKKLIVLFLNRICEKFINVNFVNQNFLVFIFIFLKNSFFLMVNYYNLFFYKNLIIISDSIRKYGRNFDIF